jgi:hypothetical protein
MHQNATATTKQQLNTFQNRLLYTAKSVCYQQDTNRIVLTKR